MNYGRIYTSFETVPTILDVPIISGTYAGDFYYKPMESGL